MVTIAYLGPPGTFSEEALLSEADLADHELVDLPTFPDVLAAVAEGRTDLGFVAVENAIEGTVNVTVDALVFEHDLLIQREVVLPVHQHLLAPAGLALDEIEHVVSFPVALAQCRRYFSTHLADAREVAAPSTSDAARMVAAGTCPPRSAAIGTRLAARLYDLEVVAESIEDHPENATRFVLVAREEAGLPAPTGHDLTSIVLFQRHNAPGSLHAILGEFAARGLDLTKLESRPRKQALGQYCFLIDVVGHIADEVVADCLRQVHASLAEVKLLGCYPAAGEGSASRRAEATEAFREADAWVSTWRQRIRR
ncbi:MAG TPA: prephenate dehydratase [Acidimicrobiales bacterium]|nr:prephenate dehydratase [Acidimicrobiales bacterium]